MTEPDNVTNKNKFQWITEAWSAGPAIAKAIISLVFIITSVTQGLYGFDLVNPSELVSNVLGAVSLTFGGVILWMFIYNGARYQPKRRK